MQKPKQEGAGTGVVLCRCGGKRAAEQTAGLSSRLAFAGIPSGGILDIEALCAPAGLDAISAFVSRRGFRKLVCAGCSPTTGRGMLEAVARAGGMPASAVQGVPLRGSAEADAREIRKAVASLDAAPSFEIREIRLDPAVLVIGGGDAARHAASGLAELGHPVTIIAHPPGRLERLEGHVGAFRARVLSPAGRIWIECGAVLVAEAAGPSPETTASLSSRFPARSVVALSALEGVVATLPREQRVRTVGIVLDLDTEEAKAGSEAALETARRLQRVGVAQVSLFAHDLRVAAPGLQELYDAARNDGMVVVKYDGKLSVDTEGDSGARVRCHDAGLDAQTEYACDLVGISAWGIAQTEADARPSRELAAALGVGCDVLGRLQENNIHLLPVLTGRTGVFVAGSPRGQHYLRDALLETEAAVAAVHALLAPGSLTVELSQAVVDEEKCALCLTCVRACPHRAMGIDAEKKIAQADAAACRRCGICAGECPAKAITLPAYSDDALLAQLAIAGRTHA